MILNICEIVNNLTGRIVVSVTVVVVCITGSVVDCLSVSVTIVMLLGIDVVPSVVTMRVVASS